MSKKTRITQVSNLKTVTLMSKYSNEELADMILIYGESQCNQRRAEQLYAQRFPERRHPVHGFILVLCERLHNTGIMSKTTRRRQRRQRPPAEVAIVLDTLEQNPHISTRKIALTTGLSQSKVQRIIENTLGSHALRCHTMQHLDPGVYHISLHSVTGYVIK